MDRHWEYFRIVIRLVDFARPACLKKNGSNWELTVRYVDAMFLLNDEFKTSRSSTG
jgi:hypothetical protein